MYHLLISGLGWAAARDTLSASRVFEYTDEEISAEFMPGGKLDTIKIASIPAILTSEISGNKTAIARIGTIHKIRISGKDVVIEYRFEPDYPILTNRDLKEMADELGISEFEFHRTHWAIKDVDLFKVLIRRQFQRKTAPIVFKIDENWTIDPKLLSVMMPFDTGFNSVYGVLKRTTKKLGLDCLRADDIWEDPAVIQDVFSLIYRSRIIICDCTRRNPNVFYEAGIAHTLGREVILVTQSKQDIPFDLQHLRYVLYQNSTKGRADLSKKLAQKISSVLKDG
jgi:hypothetical protein